MNTIFLPTYYVKKKYPTKIIDYQLWSNFLSTFPLLNKESLTFSCNNFTVNYFKYFLIS